MSTNGTFLNSESRPVGKGQTRAISSGDLIRLTPPGYNPTIILQYTGDSANGGAARSYVAPEMNKRRGSESYVTPQQYQQPAQFNTGIPSRPGSHIMQPTGPLQMNNLQSVSVVSTNSDFQQQYQSAGPPPMSGSGPYPQGPFPTPQYGMPPADYNTVPTDYNTVSANYNTLPTNYNTPPTGSGGYFG